MTPLVAARQHAVARPLKVLVPLIKSELHAGEAAGLEHYRRVGELLNEAKAQMPWGSWQKWLSKHFTKEHGLSQTTATRYMRLAEHVAAKPNLVTGDDYSAIIGHRRSRTQVHGAWKGVTDAARDLDADLFSQERQSLDEEIRLRRALVTELFDLGYRALATRLHPDRGGSKDAMARLNEVRAQLTEIAKTRRWV
jgi:hypothetical protein